MELQTDVHGTGLTSFAHFDSELETPVNLGNGNPLSILLTIDETSSLSITASRIRFSRSLR